jgi:hypothetical protein
MPEPLMVRAVAGRKLPAVDPQGRPLPGRFVAHDKKGAPLAGPVAVPADTYHRRAVERGDLALASADEG